MSTEKTKYSLKQSCSFGGNTFYILVSILKEILAEFFVGLQLMICMYHIIKLLLFEKQNGDCCLKMNRYNVIGQCQVLHGTFIDFVRLKALQI